MNYQLIKLVLLLFFPCLMYSQSKLITDNGKKLTATIDHQYANYDNPLTINYQVYPYGGSKKYQYSWRTKGAEWTEYSNKKTYTIVFDCSKNERPECTIFCRVKDINTGQFILLEKQHVVESCTKK